MQLQILIAQDKRFGNHFEIILHEKKKKNSFLFFKRIMIIEKNRKVM